MVTQTNWMIRMLWLTWTNEYFREVKHCALDIKDTAKQQMSD